MPSITVCWNRADKIILHWLGEMFDPALTGYWGSTDFAAAADTVLEIIANNVDKVEGIKISLLSKEKRSPSVSVCLRR